MDKLKLKRYELAVYLLLLLLSAVIAFTGHYLIAQETIKSIAINLASELLAVGVLFFIVNRIFLLDDNNRDDNSTEIIHEINTAKNLTVQHNSVAQKQGDRVEQALNFLVSRIERVSNSSEENSKILESIRSESALADKVQERIQINERLSTLSDQLKSTESLLTAKEQERIQTSKRLNEEFAVLSQQVKNLEATLTKTFTDVGEQLKAKQELLITDLRNTVSSSETKSYISAQVKRNLPVLVRPSNPTQPENPEAVSNALTNKIVDTYSRELSGTLDNLSSELSASYDEAAYSRVRQLLNEIERIKQQLRDLGQET
ncbi:MAG: hypothetical protein KME11_23065 [Timaviella obliquedivisa GSE-PSE-MK23-08B]|jgi:hypothetical protein|nr:hypothetical protein [Timaviella obliquedivisa GSE-PSE-MK23-08B]